MKRIVFITAEDAEYGFTLAGVSQYVAGKKDMMEIVKKVIRDPETGIVFIDERLLTENYEEDLRQIEQTWHGILIILPSPERAEMEIEDYATRLIRKAIGYHVRLRI